MIYDIPMAFHNEDGSYYVPNNYNGQWRGPLLLYNILALSLNIPSLYVLEAIGFDAAIDRAASLLGITSQAQINRLFPRVYPLGLGITSVSPAQMARAFAIFGNQGRDVSLIAIRTIEDRNGRVIYDVEREVRQRQRRLENNGQVISPQNAYAMTRIMEFGITIGTLGSSTNWGGKFTYRDENGRSFRMPAAGKTGTTQNWSDAWAVGYTPYYTTAIWYGFDKPGNSLGINQTGAQLAGPVWGDYMSEIHNGLPQKSFIRPTGVYDAAVCRRSGLLPTESCNEGVIYLTFIDGTIPARYCDMHGAVSTFTGTSLPSASSLFSTFDTSFLDNHMIQLDWDFLNDLLNPPSLNIPQNDYIFSPVPYEEIPYNIPGDNQNNSSSSSPVVIPDAPVIFIPREDEDEVPVESDYDFEGDDTLPPWDLMG
jgi:penicillin-binding protein 1A